MRFLFAFLFFLSQAIAKISVVTTFSVLTDFVEIIGGDDVVVTTLVPLKADPHTYQPRPLDVKTLAKADLVIINGLGFEGWIERLIMASGYKGRIIVASKDVKPRTLMEKGVATFDPHTWHDVKNAILYVKTIANALCEICLNSELVRQRAQNYCQELEKLDTWIQEQFQKIPTDKRIVVTTHDAFWYYGNAYRVQFLAPIGISTDAEPSAANVAKLIHKIRTENIRAIFLENLSNRRLIEQISKETGVPVDGTLYADSLGDEDLKSYIATMRHNTLTIIGCFTERS